MKRKILILALALVLIIPVMLFATACGGSKTEAKITLATTDKSKISHDYEGWSFPVNSSITSADVYGYNIYDYSELKVLVNGEVVNDNSIFQPNDFSINSYDGSKVRIGTLYFGTFKENTTISFDESSIKDIEIKIGFIHNSDSRLDWIFGTTGPYTEKGSDTNLSTFQSNYKVKINNSDLEKLEEQQHIRIIPDQYGLVSAEYLFSNDTDYQITDSSKENKYSPYMFTYNVSDFFEFDSSAYYEKPMFLYSENGFGYYNFNDENYFQSNACGENYEFEVGSLIESTQEQYYDYTIGDHSRSTIQIDDDEIVYFKDMADKGVDVKNMSNMKLNFYDNNLIILSTDNMKISNFDAAVENYAGSIMTELDGSNGNIYPIGNVNTNRTFYVTTLNDEDVSGFDFRETVVSINDTIIPEITSKTNDDIAWYELKTTNGKEYFEITIAKDILPIDFYTNEDFETFESYPLNTTKYQIKVDNIKVGDDLTGVAKLTVTTNKEKGDMEYLVIDRIWPSDSTNIYMDLDSNTQKNLYYKISGDFIPTDSPMLYFETSQMFVKYNTMKFKITSGSKEYNINLQEIQQGNLVYDEDILNPVNKYTINEANIDLMFLQDQGVYIRFNNISKDYKVDLIFN